MKDSATKRPFFRALSVLMIGQMLAAMILPAAASDALGSALTEKDTPLHQDTDLSQNTFWSAAYSDRRAENLVTYVPNETVRPIVTMGEAVAVRTSVAEAAAQLEAQGHRVVAGINGDFYEVSNGVPLGIVVTEGRLYSSDGGHHAIGFREDGTALIGKPALQITADLGYALDWGDGTLTPVGMPVKDVNKTRGDSGLYLYTYDFNAAHTTGTIQPGINVVCTLTGDGVLGIGHSTTAQVEWVEESALVQLQPGQIALSMNLLGDAAALEALRNVQPGTQIRIDTAAAPGWEEVRYALGALYVLAEDGVVAPDLAAGAHPRTAVGQKEDGTLIFYTVDGRRSGHSIGATLSQVGQRLVELGCRTVLCLDGGGSTGMVATAPDQTAASIINRPSESNRRVSNHIFLVADNAPSGQLHHFYVAPVSDYVLAGSRVQVSATGVDTHYIPMESDYTLSTSAGRLDGDHLITPPEGGDITVTARQGGSSGTAVIHAIADPERVYLKSAGREIQTLSVSPGTQTPLVPAAAWNHMELWADAGAFTWTVSEGIGTIDDQGVFTATTPGSGTITAIGGGAEVRIDVQVEHLALMTVEDFESEPPLLVDSQGTGVSRSTSDGTVQLGRASGRVDYTLWEHMGYAARAAVSGDKGFSTRTSGHTALDLWVYGDGSGNRLSFLYGNAQADGLTLEIAPLDFIGWQSFNVPLPGDFILEGLQIQAPIVGGDETFPVYGDTPRTGTVYIDHITAAFPGVVDTTPPQVHMTLHPEEWAVTAQIADDLDGTLPLRAITLAYNGTEMPLEHYDAAAGILKWYLPAPGETWDTMRITVTARDASGNLGRSSVDIPSQGVGHYFSDIQEYWAATYVDYLYTAGITTGYNDGTFRPDLNITRAQFAVMLYRSLSLDEGLYPDVQLPFADLSQVEPYALPAIRALYAMGVINGVQRDAQLYLDPNSPLTRAQAAAMIGRTQQRGYPLADLTFTDREDIPAYAQHHIRSMTGQGILSGFHDGTFRPGSLITRGQMAKILYQMM